MPIRIPISYEHLFEVTIVDVLGLAVNVLTLIFAYRLYRNFDLKKAHINKQLDTILKLLEEINAHRFNVHYYSKPPADIVAKMRDEDKERAALSSMHQTFFYISGISNSQKYESVYLNGDVMEVMPFLKFIYNPMLPSNIAHKLRAFYSPITNYSRYNNASKNFIVLSGQKQSGDTTVLQYPDFCPAFKNWDDFIKCAKELRSEIDTWLKKHGTNDVNLNFDGI